MRSVVSPEVRWLGRQVLPLMRLNLLGLLSIVAASVLTLLDPLIIKWLIDEALAQRSVALLLLGAIGFGAAYFGQLAFSYAAYLVGFVVSQKMIFRIRVALIRRLHVLSARYYENTPVGEILYRVQQDVDGVRYLLWGGTRCRWFGGVWRRRPAQRDPDGGCGCHGAGHYGCPQCSVNP